MEDTGFGLQEQKRDWEHIFQTEKERELLVPLFGHFRTLKVLRFQFLTSRFRLRFENSIDIFEENLRV